MVHDRTTGIPLRNSKLSSILRVQTDKFKSSKFLISFLYLISFNIAREFLFSFLLFFSFFFLHLIPRNRVSKSLHLDRLRSMENNYSIALSGGPTVVEVIRRENRRNRVDWNRVQKPHPTLDHKSTAVR